MLDVQSRTGAKNSLRPGRANLLRCLRGLASERPDDAAFVCPTDDPSQRTAMTYAQLDRRARAIAACLQDMELAGQRVILAYPPGLEFIAAFFGALYAGCVAVPTYLPRHRTRDRFEALAADSGASRLTTVLSSVKAMAARPRNSWLPGRIADFRAGVGRVRPRRDPSDDPYRPALPPSESAAESRQSHRK